MDKIAVAKFFREDKRIAVVRSFIVIVVQKDDIKPWKIFCHKIFDLFGAIANNNTYGPDTGPGQRCQLII